VPLKSESTITRNACAKKGSEYTSAVEESSMVEAPTMALGLEVKTVMSKKKDVWRPEWHEVTNAEAHQVTGSTLTPSQVFPYPTGNLPVQLQKLPGLYGAYISGYATGSISPENVTVLGEVVAVREDEGMGKGYVWAFGVSGSGVYVNGPYKFFDGHHFADTASVPVDKLFGNVPTHSSPLSIAANTASLSPGQPAQKSKTIAVRFALHEPTATGVSLCGDFNRWAVEATPMQRSAGSDVWEVNVELAPGRYEYKFVIDGQWKEDPLANEKVVNSYGTPNSVVVVPS
jgi:hypothetical protein